MNLEYLASVVMTKDGVAFPDSLVGTDSHTTMINGLGVVGWGVGGIEAEAVMLGQPIYMLTPEVVGFELKGTMPEGATATDLVLTVVQMLREHGVVGKFVEFHGPALAGMSLADRATIANMAPEYGATMGFFPVDAETLDYLRRTGRPADLVDTVERYTKANGLFLDSEQPDADLLQRPVAGRRHGRPLPRRSEAAAGPHPADRHEGHLGDRAEGDLRQVHHHHRGQPRRRLGGGGRPAGRSGRQPPQRQRRRRIVRFAGGRRATLEAVAAPAGTAVRDAVVDPGFDGVEVTLDEEPSN